MKRAKKKPISNRRKRKPLTDEQIERRIDEKIASMKFMSAVVRLMTLALDKGQVPISSFDSSITEKIQ